MQIAPTSKILLLKGCPLNKKYTDTIYFNSVEDQWNYFYSLEKKEFLNTQYVRVNDGKIRVGIVADQIYSYNYLMFQNTAYGNKWFYAFITNVHYVNNSTSIVEYEIDVMQTWFFEAVLQPSFVEREHTATDNPGEWVAAEPVDIGPIECYETYKQAGFDNYEIVACLAQRNE